MTREDNDLPLSEWLRPKSIDELVLPERITARLQHMYDTQTPDNMLFFGPPGTGKTSTAAIFTRQRGFFGVLNVDGSKETGIDYIRKVIETFASCYPLDPGIKICVIDDADFVSKSAQASLRGIIERYITGSRFILIVNDLNKIDPAIRSRLLCINFANSRRDTDIMDHLKKRVAGCLVQLGWSFDETRLNQIVVENFSDLRRMANKIQFEFRK